MLSEPLAERRTLTLTFSFYPRSHIMPIVAVLNGDASTSLIFLEFVHCLDYQETNTITCNSFLCLHSIVFPIIVIIIFLRGSIKRLLICKNIETFWYINRFKICVLLRHNIQIFDVTWAQK